LEEHAAYTFRVTKLGSSGCQSDSVEKMNQLYGGMQGLGSIRAIKRDMNTDMETEKARNKILM
jgi:hypothetical protein